MTDAAEPAPEKGPTLLDKAQAVTARVERLQRDVSAAHRLAHRAQVREVLTRTELTLALHEALIARAELEARHREKALGLYLARPGGAVGGDTGFRIKADKVLIRLGSVGQAAVIARSGVWRGTGRRLHDLRHMAAYARRGPNPGIAAPAPFDQAWYLASYPDVAASRMAPLVHYLTLGGREGRSPGPLFDDAYYRSRNAEALATTDLTPLEHYRRIGAAQARSPHPLFDFAHYLAQDPALAPDEDPVTHYLREGAALGLSPHPLFDPRWYAEQGAATGDLVHYVTEGWRQGLSPHPLFDPGWYCAQNPDVAQSGAEPLAHFLLAGAFEGRSPSPWFDLPFYAAERGAARKADVNPLVDYLRGGAWAVAEPRPGFPSAAYVAPRQDLVRAGITPLELWARNGGR